MIKCLPLSGLLSTESALGNSKNKSSSARINFVIKQQHSKSATATRQRDILMESSVVLLWLSLSHWRFRLSFPCYISVVYVHSPWRPTWWRAKFWYQQSEQTKETYSKMFVIDAEICSTPWNQLTCQSQTRHCNVSSHERTYSTCSIEGARHGWI